MISIKIKKRTPDDDPLLDADKQAQREAAFEHYHRIRAKSHDGVYFLALPLGWYAASLLIGWQLAANVETPAWLEAIFSPALAHSAGNIQAFYFAAAFILASSPLLFSLLWRKVWYSERRLAHEHYIDLSQDEIGDQNIIGARKLYALFGKFRLFIAFLIFAYLFSALFFAYPRGHLKALSTKELGTFFGVLEGPFDFAEPLAVMVGSLYLLFYLVYWLDVRTWFKRQKPAPAPQTVMR